MPSLSMFSSLLYSKDKLSWLPVVFLRQRFLLCLIEQHHTGRKEGGRIVFPKAIAGTEITHTGFSMSLLWKKGLLFSCSSFCRLLYPSFLSVFCLWPHCSLLYISPCFHLLLLYTVNPRQSVLTGVLLYSLGNIYILSVPFPGTFFNASTGASQPAANFPLLQLSKKLTAADWVPVLSRLSWASPFGYSWWLLPRSPHHGPVSLSVVRVAGTVGTESANQPSIFHNCIFFFPLKNIGFLLTYRFPFNLFGRYSWHLWGNAV